MSVGEIIERQLKAISIDFYYKEEKTKENYERFCIKQ